MTIQEAIEILEKKKSQTNDQRLQNRLDSLINDIYEYFGRSDTVNEKIEQTLNNADTTLKSVNYTWVMRLNEAFLLMKHRQTCKQYLVEHKNKIDGETAQWWTSIGQGIFGVISIIFTFLFAFGVIPKEIFGPLGDGNNSDALYYIIGTIGQQIFVLILAIIIGIINKKRMNKKYGDLDFTFEELLAVKYENQPIRLKYLSPLAAKTANNIIIALGKDSQASGNNSFKTSGDHSPIIVNKGVETETETETD